MKYWGRILVLLPSLCYATVWYVHPDSALNIIQWALDSCEHYDTVLVASGTYHEHIMWPGCTGIKLLSEADAQETVIDADNNYRVFTLPTGLDTHTVINGFTIIGGATGEYGGGIYCNDNSCPLIVNNMICNNTATCGGGVYVMDNAVIRNNTIKNNGANDGGAIGCDINASPRIYNNKVLYNTAIGFPGRGGGIYIDQGSATINGNDIIGNQGYAGGGLFSNDVDSTVFIMSNTFDSNTVSWAGGGIFCTGSPNIADNLFSNNIAVYGAGLAYWWDYSIPIILGNTFDGNSAVYGGGISDAYWSDGRNLSGIFSRGIHTNRNSTPIIEKSIFIANIADTGAVLCCIYNTSPLIDSCSFLDNCGDAVFCSNASNPLIHNCNLSGSTGYAINNISSSIVINAEYNWWGDSTGPYHPDSNPMGLGDSVSDYVDFIPWLYWPWMEEYPSGNLVVNGKTFSATILTGPIPFPADKPYKIFDITGRQIHTLNPAPGIYFIQLDDKIVQKVIKIK